MYRGIRRLVEGLFDDDIINQDISVEDEIEDIGNKIYNNDEKYLYKLAQLIKYFSSFTWYPYDDVTYEIENDSAIFYYTDKNNNIKIIKEFYINIDNSKNTNIKELTNKAKEVFNCFKNILNINKFLFTLDISNRNTEYLELDFNNKQFVGINLLNVNIKNLKVNKIDSPALKSPIS